MSREIKFRVWNLKEKKMTYNAEHAYDYGAYFKVDICTSCFGELLEDDDYIVEQFTGLKDKNGKEIYEGDIIVAFGFCHKYTVEWSEKYAAFETIDLTDGEMGPSIEFTAKYATVIGNIHENPELLGGEE